MQESGRVPRKTADLLKIVVQSSKSMARLRTPALALQYCNLQTQRRNEAITNKAESERGQPKSLE